MSDTEQPSDHNPFDASPPAHPLEGFQEQPEEHLPKGAPSVAAQPGKAFLVLGVVGAAVLFLLYSIFFSGGKEDVVAKPNKIEVASSAEPPPLPPVEPAFEAPPPSLAAPTLPEPVDIPQINPKDDGAAREQELARMRSSMMLVDGGASIASDPEAAEPAGTPKDPNSAFAASIGSNVERVNAKRIGNLNRTIAQGRIIQATMESALTTDLPAPIRAIVSRDTYGEAGNVPLIPKGSRLIGTYNTSISSGQTRVFVVWTRVIRPDGIDVALGSPLVDGIGRAGVGGQVDSKFQEIFSRAVVSSAMNIAMAIGSEKIAGGTTTTTNSTTGSQTSGDAASTATTNALNRLGSVTDGFVQKFLGVTPTILVDQGTVVNVFVNKDLIFPTDAAGGAQVLN